MTREDYDRLQRGWGVIVAFGGTVGKPMGEQYGLVYGRRRDGIVTVCKFSQRSRKWTKPRPVRRTEMLRLATVPPRNGDPHCHDIPIPRDIWIGR